MNEVEETASAVGVADVSIEVGDSEQILKQGGRIHESPNYSAAEHKSFKIIIETLNAYDSTVGPQLFKDVHDAHNIKFKRTKETLFDHLTAMKSRC